MRLLKNWYILAIGLLAIAGAFAYASFSTSSLLPTITITAPAISNASDASIIPALEPLQEPAKAEALVASPTTPAPVEIAQAEAPTPVAALQGPTASAGDATAGRQVYKKCQACHSLEAGKNRVGPSLAGIVGRQSASVPGFSYSEAMKKTKVVWDPQTLDQFLSGPQKMIAGNKMPFPGLKTEHDRSDVIAFLASSGSAAPAATAAEAPAAESVAATPSVAPDTAGPAIRNPGYIPDARYTLRTGIAEGRMVFLGVGGDIDGQVNPAPHSFSRASGATHTYQRRGRPARHRIP